MMSNSPLGSRSSNSPPSRGPLGGSGHETHGFHPAPRFRQNIHVPLDFGYAGSRFAEQPESPDAPFPLEEEILLNTPDDPEGREAPRLSFNLDRPDISFTVSSAGGVAGDDRVGSQSQIPSHPVRHESFSELLSPPIPHSHPSRGAQEHNFWFTSTASSRSSNSFVNVVSQPSSQPPHSQYLSQEAGAYLTAGSDGRLSPGSSNPGHISNTNSPGSSPGHLPGSQPRAGPSQSWTVPPMVRRLLDTHLIAHLK